MRLAILVIPATLALVVSGSALRRGHPERNPGSPIFDIIDHGFGFGGDDGPQLTEAEEKEIEELVKEGSKNFDKLIKDCAKLDKATKDAQSTTDTEKPDESKRAACDDLNHFLQWERENAQRASGTKPHPFNPDDYKPRKLCCNGLCVQTTNRYASHFAPGKYCPALNDRTCYNPITAGCCDAPHYC